MSDELHGMVLGDEEPTVDSPPTVQEPVEDEAEPEGAVDVQGRRMVDVSVLKSVRLSARERAEKALREKELTPLQTELQRLREEHAQLTGALNESRPYIERLRQRPDLMRDPEPTPEEQKISDQEAETYARRFELYKAGTGELDTVRAKAIMADHRRETQQIADQAAQKAVQPLANQTAAQQAQANFAYYASQRDADGRPRVDPNLLAQKWNQFPPHITADPRAAMVIFDAAIGEMVRTGKQPPAPPAREPNFTEPSGGRGQQPFRMNDVTRKLAQASGMTEKEMAAGAAKYQPGVPNVIGE